MIQHHSVKIVAMFSFLVLLGGRASTRAQDLPTADVRFTISDRSSPSFDWRDTSHGRPSELSRAVEDPLIQQSLWASSSTERGTDSAVQPAAVRVSKERLSAGAENELAAASSRANRSVPRNVMQGIPLDPPKRPENGSATGGAARSSTFSMIVSLLFVVGGFLLVVWIARVFGRRPVSELPTEVVDVLGRQSLGSNHSLLLIRFGQRLLLVSQHQHGCQVLCEVGDADEHADIVERCKIRTMRASRNSVAWTSLLSLLSSRAKMAIGEGDAATTQLGGTAK